MTERRQRYIARLVELARTDPGQLQDRITRRLASDDGPPPGRDERSMGDVVQEAIGRAQGDREAIAGFRAALSSAVQALALPAGFDGGEREAAILSGILSLVAGVVWPPGTERQASWALEPLLPRIEGFHRRADGGGLPFPAGTLDGGVALLAGMAALNPLIPDLPDAFKRLWDASRGIADPVKRADLRVRAAQVAAGSTAARIAEYHGDLYRDIQSASGAAGNLAGLHLRIGALHGDEAVHTVLKGAAADERLPLALKLMSSHAAEKDYLSSFDALREVEPELHGEVARRLRDPADADGARQRVRRVA